ncbi:MAG: hypothetical protein U5L45_09465 [Saprospiraceae bacterium]|nr:hypothetical protein [Saprospiraceae bacterium]
MRDIGFCLFLLRGYYICFKKRIGKKGQKLVHFSGFARKMNHIPLFCERSLKNPSTKIVKEPIKPKPIQPP